MATTHITPEITPTSHALANLFTSMVEFMIHENRIISMDEVIEKVPYMLDGLGEIHDTVRVFFDAAAAMASYKIK